AIESGANILVIGGSAAAAAKDLIDDARKLSSGITLELSGLVTLENVRAYAEAGADLIRVDALTQSVRAMDISFQIQPGLEHFIFHLSFDILHLLISFAAC